MRHIRFVTESRQFLMLIAFLVIAAIAAPTVIAASAQPARHGHVRSSADLNGFPGSAALSATWPEYRFGPTRTGYNPYEHVLSPSTVGHLRLDWISKTSRFNDASAVVAGGIAYTGSQDGIFRAIDLRTGRTIWSAARGEVENGTAAVDSGVVYYLGANDLWARDAKTGALLWFTSVPHALHDLSSPTVVGGLVYTDSDNSVNAYSAQTGTPVWTQPVPASAFGQSSPAVSNGIVYYGAADGVHAFNASNGTPLWSFAMGGQATTPAVSNGLVYAVAPGELVALDAQTGTEKWSYANPGLLHASPAVANGHVYIGTYGDGNPLSSDGTLLQLDASTGALGWSFQTQGLINYTSPAVANGVVYTGSFDDTIYALSEASGHELWSFATSGQIEASPTVVAGMLIISSDDYNTYAFSLGPSQQQPPPLAAACAAWSGIYQLAQAPVIPEVRISDGTCRFGYEPGDTYSGQGTFTIRCSGGGGPFTTAGFDLPLTGCSGQVSIWMGHPGHNAGSIVVAGAPPVKPTPCTATCLDAVETNDLALLNATGQ